MFSTFWILYLTSFVGTTLKDDQEVSDLYAKLMMCSVIAGLAFAPFLGMFADRVSPRLTLPLAFLVRASAIALFYFIIDPRHVFAYVVGAYLILGTSFEQIATDCVT